MRAVMAIILTFLVFIPTIQTIQSAQSARNDLVIDVPPTVFDAGKMQTFTVELRNLGEETLENVTVKIVSGGTPITILGINERFIKSIEPYSTENTQFSLYIEESAESKGYNLPISVFYQKKWETIEYNATVGIRIIGKKPVLKINAEPITMKIGEEKDIKIEVTNKGNAIANDIKCSLSSDSIALLSPSSKFIKSLLPEQSEIITYTITSNVSGVHSLLLNVTYGNTSENVSTNCKVVGKPDLVLTGLEINKNESIYEITGNIANVGMDKALYVVLSVEKGVYPYKDYFIGTLEPNDFASFELHSSSSSQEIPVKIVYRDVFNNLEEEDRSVEIEKKTQGGGETQQVSFWVYLLTVFIAVLIIGIIVYSWTRGRKE